MKPIGGFFELELPKKGTKPHPKSLALNTGRACLMVMMEHIKPKRVYVPFYTCDATHDPFRKLGIKTSYYALDQTLFPVDLPDLKADEYFLWTDYFGVCENHTSLLKKKYGEKLLIDDTHNFFREGHTEYWSFTSARKYFGVPDGAFLYSPASISVEVERFKGLSLRHGLLRHLGDLTNAHSAFQDYERSLNCSVYKISEVSESLLGCVDFEEVKCKRNRNFKVLHSILGDSNQLVIDQIDQTPFCYPYFPKKPVSREKLYANQVFVPTLWIDTKSREGEGYSFEREISERLLPLPIDHRYGDSDMEYVVGIVKGCLGE